MTTNSQKLALEYGLPDIAKAVDPVWPDFTAQALASIDSTNTELMRRARTGLESPCLLVAREQTAGKGRMGKPWQSQPEASLAFSLGIPLRPQQWSGLSLVVGMVVAEQLQKLQEQSKATEKITARLGVKWPNDLWVMDAQNQGRKLAGILIETANQNTPQTAEDPLRYTIVGIGINMQQPAAAPEQGFSTPPVSLAEWLPDHSMIQILQAIVPALADAVQTFETQGFAPWHSKFSQWDILANQEVKLSDGRGGVAIGIGTDGALLLQTEQGIEAITSGEVSVRPSSQAGPKAFQ